MIDRICTLYEQIADFGNCLNSRISLLRDYVYC